MALSSGYIDQDWSKLQLSLDEKLSSYNIELPVSFDPALVKVEVSPSLGLVAVKSEVSKYLDTSSPQIDPPYSNPDTLLLWLKRVPSTSKLNLPSFDPSKFDLPAALEPEAIKLKLGHYVETDLNPDKIVDTLNNMMDSVALKLSSFHPSSIKITLLDDSVDMDVVKLKIERYFDASPVKQFDLPTDLDAESILRALGDVWDTSMLNIPFFNPSSMELEVPAYFDPDFVKLEFAKFIDGSAFNFDPNDFKLALANTIDPSSMKFDFAFDPASMNFLDVSSPTFIPSALLLSSMAISVAVPSSSSAVDEQSTTPYAYEGPASKRADLIYDPIESLEVAASAMVETTVAYANDEAQTINVENVTCMVKTQETLQTYMEAPAIIENEAKKPTRTAPASTLFRKNDKMYDLAQGLSNSNKVSAYRTESIVLKALAVFCKGVGDLPSQWKIGKSIYARLEPYPRKNVVQSPLFSTPGKTTESVILKVLRLSVQGLGRVKIQLGKPRAT